MDTNLTLRDYQQCALRTDRSPGDGVMSILIPLLGLASESGSLLGEYKKWFREGNRYKPFSDQVSEELGDILWYVAVIAKRAGLDLQEIAEENLAKLADRWPDEDESEGLRLFPKEPDRYDAGYPTTEQLPRKFRVEFRESQFGSKLEIRLNVNGNEYGDPVADNAHASDGYRFHDVFHFTFATLLGWSPIVRKLLRVKRKSNAQVDEIEDGARADRTEEAISAAIFAYARDYSYFRDTESVDYDLLRMIQLISRPFEVRDRTLRDWEKAILQGYAVWRQMLVNRGGVFVGDSEAGTVTYEPFEQPTN